jgi:endonuclease/exonuclease/phosphatase family metal-dependent hydrolase
VTAAPVDAGDRSDRRLAEKRIGEILGSASTAAGAALWIGGPFLPFAPPLHTWLLVAGLLLGLAGLVAQLRRPSAAGAAFAALGIVLCTAFVGFLVGPVRPSARALDPAPGSVAPRLPHRLKILDLNVLHGYPSFERQEERFRSLSQAISHLQPDIVLLQEAWCTRRHGCLINRLATEHAPLAGYHLAYAPVNGSLRLIGFEEGLAIASRWPIEAVAARTLAPRELPWRRRGLLRAELRIGRVAWTFATAHLANEHGSRRVAQARSLAGQLAADGPLVLGADLNDRAGSPTLAPFSDRSFQAVLDGDRDHLWVRDLPDGWRVESARWRLTGEDLEALTGRSMPVSDHPAAWVELVLDEP